MFVGRAPLAGLAAVLNVPADELPPILTALQDWSLCFWDADAQTFEVHSLTRTWLRSQALPEPDRFKAICQQAGEFFRDQPTWDDELLAIDYFKQAESWEDYATAAFRLAGHYRLTGLYPAAWTLNEEVLSHNISPKQNANAMNSLGILSISTGDYETALTYLEQSLTIQQQIGDKKGEGTTLNNISQIYDARGDYETALNYLEQSLRIRQQIGDKKGEGATLNNISQIYQARGDYQTALKYLEQSLTHSHSRSAIKAGKAPPSTIWLV